MANYQANTSHYKDLTVKARASSIRSPSSRRSTRNEKKFIGEKNKPKLDFASLGLASH